MGQLSDALWTAALQLEARLRTHHEQMFQDGLGSVFPQSWRFETESETAVLRIDRAARVTVEVDVIEPPSVIVRWTQDALMEALLSGRSNEQARANPPKIRFTSDAGRRAFSMLGTSLGL
jgi:hypothetical protein